MLYAFGSSVLCLLTNAPLLVGVRTANCRSIEKASMENGKWKEMTNGKCCQPLPIQPAIAAGRISLQMLTVEGSNLPGVDRLPGHFGGRVMTTGKPDYVER